MLPSIGAVIWELLNFLVLKEITTVFVLLLWFFVCLFFNYVFVHFRWNHLTTVFVKDRLLKKWYKSCPPRGAGISTKVREEFFKVSLLFVTLFTQRTSVFFFF